MKGRVRLRFEFQVEDINQYATSCTTDQKRTWYILYCFSKLSTKQTKIGDSFTSKHVLLKNYSCQKMSMLQVVLLI